MTDYRFLLFGIFTLLLVYACTSTENKNLGRLPDSLAVDTFTHTQPDNIISKLKPIIENYTEIDARRIWSDTVAIELNETSEGGQVTYYYFEGRLEKIITQSFGETFQKITSYYLMDGQLSFVNEKIWQYNRPIYYDKEMMEEGGDSEYFDFNKSTVTEVTSYFEKNKPIHWVAGENEMEEIELYVLAMDFVAQFHRLIDLLDKQEKY
jgi:hypothetical protein